MLVHENPPELAPSLLERAGFAELAPVVRAVLTAFGRLWKLRTDDDARDYVVAHRAHLELLLLFELVHEGAPASWMRRIAALAGLEPRFEAWVERLERGTVSPQSS